MQIYVPFSACLHCSYVAYLAWTSPAPCLLGTLNRRDDALDDAQLRCLIGTSRRYHTALHKTVDCDFMDLILKSFNHLTDENSIR